MVKQATLNYSEAISFLFSSLPMYQRVGKIAYKSNLDNSHTLDRYFESPHRHFHCIHVAGTNGKGSVSHLLAAVLQSAGYVTGLYTSPHMKDFRERIKINGKMIPEEKVLAFVEKHQGILAEIKPSFFEMTVAMAFDHFAREKVDVAVIEVGMGGRLDSTNIITPVLSVITNIGTDHGMFLGDSPVKIAWEKAGIIKQGIPVVIGESQEEVRKVFEKQAGELQSPLCFADEEFSIDYSTLSLDGRQSMNVYRQGKVWKKFLETDLLGLYQRKNIITLLGAVTRLDKSIFSLPESAVRLGLAQCAALTGLRGRWEIIGNNPLVVCDTAHNREGIIQVIEQVRQTPHKVLHMIIGTVVDKNPDHILSLLPSGAKYYFTQASVPRAMDKEEFATAAFRYGIYGEVCRTPNIALEMARKVAGSSDLILISGSSFVVADVL